METRREEFRKKVLHAASQTQGLFSTQRQLDDQSSKHRIKRATVAFEVRRAVGRTHARLIFHALSLLIASNVYSLASANICSFDAMRRDFAKLNAGRRKVRIATNHYLVIFRARRISSWRTRAIRSFYRIFPLTLLN